MDRYVRHNYGGERLVSGKTIKQNKSANGYLCVPISINGTEKRMLVHRLVMLAFVGQSDMQVNHKDGNKQNNHIDNLEYCTPSQNIKHSFSIGKSSNKGDKHPKSKLTNKQAAEIIRRSNSGEKTSILGAEYGVCQSAISNIKYGRAYNRN